jgi:hypothetical protein
MILLLQMSRGAIVFHDHRDHRVMIQQMMKPMITYPVAYDYNPQIKVSDLFHPMIEQPFYPFVVLYKELDTVKLRSELARAFKERKEVCSLKPGSALFHAKCLLACT